MSDPKREIHLYIPGPAGVTPEVMEALGRPVEPHYGKEFVAAYNLCIERLKAVFQTRNDLFLIVGPGTSALDAGLTSALPEGARVLVPSNGWFGDRVAEMCLAHGAETELVSFKRGEPFDVERIVGRLAEGGFDAIAWVHHETSTGMLNPVEPLCAAARRAGAVTILDAVASLGGTELPVDEWGVDLCVSVSNKCLAAPAGLAAISVSRAAWQAIDASTAKRGWYLNLATWRRYRREWAAWHPYPTTVPTGLVHALAASLEQILAEGLEARLRRTAAAASAVRGGLRRLGFEMLIDDRWASPITTSVRAHPEMPVGDLQKALRERHGIYISGGLDDLHGVIFRVGHMGLSIEASEVERLLAAVEDCLRRAGVTVTEPAALEGG